MIQLFYLNSTTVLQRYSLADLLTLLPDSMVVRAKRYHKLQDAYNFVLGRLLLRQALFKNNLPWSHLETIAYTPTGKPYLPALHFNISHSQDWVACASSTQMVMGLDIEVPRSIEKKHFRASFSQKEWDEIVADEHLHTFYQYWTAKEAVLKASGLGLGHLLDMTLVDMQEAFVKLPNEEQASQWQLQHFSLSKSTAYCCLCAKYQVDITPELLDVEQLLR